MSQAFKPHFDDDIEALALNPVPRLEAVVRPSVQAAAERAHWRLNATASGASRKGDFSLVKPALPEYAALNEAERCLGCADAPCGHSCPCHIDVRAFIRAESRGDYYEAARVIYSDNPLGWTCGLLCSTSHQCRGGCNLNRLGHPIDIAALQQVACENFHKMRIPQVRPTLPADANVAAYQQKITLIGAGPASLSCATYLARLGYSNITILEKEAVPGGILSSEIQEFRIPFSVVEAETRMVTELGVNIQYNTPVGVAGRTLEALKAESKAIFVGCGLPQAFTLPVLQGAPANVMTSKAFLRSASLASRFKTGAMPALSGHVLILGGGDVAFDTAATAFRCGADRVTLAFREDIPSMPASWEELEHGLRTKCDMLGNVVPQRLVVEGDRCTGAVLATKNWNAAQGVWVEGQPLETRCTAVIVAFGATCADAAFLAPLALERNTLPLNKQTMQSTQDPMIFAGGDIAGSHSIVEAVNDGKTAAWHMHCMLQRVGGTAAAQLPDPAKPKMPALHTVVDDVDVSSTWLGLKFINPFGLSSAPPVTSVGMIKRAFAEGWGFCVTKTLCPDEMMVTNISPRIVRASTSNHHGSNQQGFMNIELLTEKSELYWEEGIKELKRDYPAHIVICSIMCPYEQEPWQRLARRMAAAGADALELNLSCPHTGKKGTGMLAGQSADAVREITRWVRDVVHIPVITKLTPNITDISLLAEAAKQGGASAVTAINTVQSLTTVRPDGLPWPNVEGFSAYGGLSGNVIRPIALKAISSIARRCGADFPISGCGGIDSAETGMQMIHAGASNIQITSAIQDHCYAIVSELVNGFKYYLYSQARDDLRAWCGQVPPPAATLGAPVALSQPVPALASQVGRVVSRIKVVPELNLQAQLCAQLEEDKCLHCGKCYMSCNDTGYQSIHFNRDTHLPEFHPETCMGCALCFSVCPAGAIKMVPKPVPHWVSRGIPNRAIPSPFPAAEDMLPAHAAPKN